MMWLPRWPSSKRSVARNPITWSCARCDKSGRTQCLIYIVKRTCHREVTVQTQQNAIKKATSQHAEVHTLSDRLAEAHLVAQYAAYTVLVAIYHPRNALGLRHYRARRYNST